jgi:glucan 1,3-beta-glucosidase
MNTLNRRRFLQTTSLAGAALLSSVGVGSAQTETGAMPKKIHGVNLGGWLVLEKWIKPSLFDGQSAEDEYSLCQALGADKAAALLKEHRETWITAEDFKWLKARGINSVRLPVGYWVMEENSPFISGLETMDWAFRTAKENGMSVLLDLHGAPGSQNGWDHSGRAGEIGWYKSQDNIDHTLRVIEALATHCKQHDNLLGIELLNEPRDSVPLEILKKYYQDAYQRIRQQLTATQAAVVFHDSFRAFAWEKFMSGPEYQNVILDTHLYQCFSDEDHRRSMPGQIELAAVQRKQQLDRMGRDEMPCIVGEWSLGLPEGNMKGLDAVAQDAALRAFAAAQLLSYEGTRGWYFWCYRTESGGGWSFRDSVKQGWMPDKYEG